MLIKARKSGRKLFVDALVCGAYKPSIETPAACDDRSRFDYSKVIELVPEDWQAYELRGEAYLVLQRNHQAERDFQRCIEIKPHERRTIEAILRRARPPTTR
jgi:hypothetical protein